MPRIEARIRTDRAGRYLTQLCEHTARISAHPGRHQQSAPRHAEHSGTEGIIEFDNGRCTLRATAEELILVAEADDQEHLRLMRDALTTRLRHIGRRDRLTLTWRPG